MSKRGLSTIVVVLIIVLLGLVAVGIIWAVVKGIIDVGVGQIGISAKCMNIDVKATSVVNVGETNYTVVLEREAGGDDIGGVKIIFTNATAGINFQHLVPGNMEPHEVKTESNIATGIANANKVEVIVYFIDESEKEQYCSRSNSYDIKGEGANGNGGNGAVCGNGSIEGSEECDDNNTISGDGCSSTCSIEGGWECTGEPSVCTEIGGSCLTSDNCTDFGYECGDWDNLCEGTFNCGNCSALYGLGYECNAIGQCEIETYVNNGTVGSVWPPGVGLYFDSEDLPKSGIDYYGYHINFTGAESDCLLIAGYFTPTVPEVYNLTHIRFSFPTDIATGDKYEIWESSDCGEAV
ncbi:hypothetical protein ES703_98517 [subsurface metagenome]